MLNDKLKLRVQDDELKTTRVDEALYILSRQYGRAVLLLDRFGGDPLQESVNALTSPPANSLLLDDPIFKDDLQRAPLLLELLHKEPTHHALLEQSITLAREQASDASGSHQICAWLFTNVSLEHLQRELRQRLDVRYPGGERIYLRYFDPRVMPRLAQLLGPPTDEALRHHSSFAQLLGPVQTWCQLDREGQLLRHDNPEPTSVPFGGHLRFDEHSAAAIDRIETINLTARALAQRATPCKQSDDAVIDAQLVAGQKLGLRNGDDQVAYAWRAIRYGAPFTLQPTLNELVTQALTQGIPLEALLDEHLPSRHFDDARA